VTGRSGWHVPRRRLPAVLLAASVTLLISACSAPQESVDDGAEPSEETSEELDLATKPDLATVLTDDRGEPPSTLQVADLVEGEGDPADDGDALTVHYVGASWSSGAQFDATWDRGQPYTFTLGTGENIAGWEQGLRGMRVGGRRVLVIPPDLAYGDRGAGSDIAPGETITFVIDLLEVAG
jgi:peptidylprolyl isomerase